MTRLTVHRRCTVDATGCIFIEGVVACPAGTASVAVEACSQCGYRRASAVGGIVECDRPIADGGGPQSFQAQLQVVPAIAVGNREILLARPDAPVAALRERMARDRAPCVVVDETNVALGIITMRDLEAQPADAVAGDAMTAPIVTLGQSATVTRAAAVLVYEGIHHLPVVDEAGRVVALLSSLDVLRHVARGQGFLLAEHSSRRGPGTTAAETVQGRGGAALRTTKTDRSA